MARIYPLFSSSKGNSFFFGTPEEGILIDCGVSCRKRHTRFRDKGDIHNPYPLRPYLGAEDLPEKDRCHYLRTAEKSGYTI